MGEKESMNGSIQKKNNRLTNFLNKLDFKLKNKLILIFLIVNAIPIFFLSITAVMQKTALSNTLKEKAVISSMNALNDSSRENLERLTVDIAMSVNEFLHLRDQDILLLASLPRTESVYKSFSLNKQSRVMVNKEWVLSEDKMTWIEKEPFRFETATNISTNRENDDILLGSSYNNRPPEFFEKYKEFKPLYDELTFLDLYGNEVLKYINVNSTKVHYPLNPNKQNVSDSKNTYIRSENYFSELSKLKEGEIYVSNVIGAYVGTKYIGMFTPGVLKSLSPTHPNYDELQKIADLPEHEFLKIASRQSYAGLENPNGQRFEGIIRWGTPVLENGVKVGYVTFALNHIHLMEFVDYVDPMPKRYTILPSPHTGNYAFIWDNKCRNICHPRHNSIAGYNPVTGEHQVPWLEGSISIERDYVNGGFLRDENNATIPILTDGQTTLAKDSPFFYWYSNGGQEWLKENPNWEKFNLSKVFTGKNWWEHEIKNSNSKGVSWDAFYFANIDNREMLPQFGERPLRNDEGNLVITTTGKLVTDYQSRAKSPANLLTKGGYVGLDGRYLNNAPQCTGWMDLTANGGSGSFYILWSGLYKPTTASAISYYTGQYKPERQKGSKRGFGIVTIGAEIEDFTEPAKEMELELTYTIGKSIKENTVLFTIIVTFILSLITLIAILISKYITSNIELLLDGLSKFRSGLRRFRLNVDIKDEFGDLAKSFDEMADSIVNSESGFIAITDLECNVIYANDATLKVWNLSNDDIRGLSYLKVSIYPPNSRFDPIKALHESRESDVLFEQVTGHYFKGEASYIHNPQGDKVGYIISTHDVTEIEDARRRAEQASDAKTSFLANMSHEIRTPMNAIIGVTEILLENEEITEDLKESLEKIYNSSELLLGIINDILDLSKVEAGKMDIVQTEYFISSLINDTTQLNIMRIEDKPLKFEIEIDDQIPAKLIGDQIRIKQVLNNLLSNAFKYTDEGRVIFSVASEPSAKKDEVIIVFIVQDTGQGMTNSQLSIIFEAYSRFADKIKKSIEGTGLGLGITKQLINLMQGEIEIDSEVNVGTRITVKLPQQVMGKEILGSDVVSNLKRFRSYNRMANTRKKFVRKTMSEGKVLIVDDLESNLYVAKALLTPYKLKIETVTSGEEAITKIKIGNEYDIIFMDHMMPYMDGIETTKIIRDLNYLKPIVALTANAVVGQSEIFLQNGFNDFISKPIDTEKLNNILNNYINLK